MTDHPNAPTDNLPAKQEPPKQKDRMEFLIAAVEQRSDMLQKLLADTGITFERFVEVFRRALIKNPDLLGAEPASVIEACINAATDGLLPDGRAAAIVVYNVKVSKRGEPDKYAKKANYQPMYQGLLDLAYKSGNFRSIEARVVYDGDFFEYELGDEPRIRHRPKSRPQNTAAPAIVAAYAVAKTVNGGVYREIFEGADIAKVNAVSRATNGPMKNWPEEAARKGPLRRMWKFLPKSPEMNRIVDRDNEGFDLTQLEDLETTPQTAKRGFSAGFSQPALQQGADPTVDLSMGREKEHAQAGDAGVLDETQRADAAGADQGQADGAGAQHSAADDGDGLPAGSATRTFETQLAAAANWASVKHALGTFRQATPPPPAFADEIACQRAWARMVELTKAKKDRTDFVSDPLLFEIWLVGVDPAPSSEAVAGNWEIVQADKAWAKLEAPDRDRITGRVTEALGAQDS